MSEKANRICGIVSMVLTILNAVILSASTLWSILVRSKFKMIYDDMEIKLPVVTQTVMDLPWFVFVTVSLLLMGLLLVKEALKQKWIPLTINIVWIAATSIYQTLYAIILLLPMVVIIGSLS